MPNAPKQSVISLPTIVVWDVGRVLAEWDLALLYRDAIPDPAERAQIEAELEQARAELAAIIATEAAERDGEPPN